MTTAATNNNHNTLAAFISSLPFNPNADQLNALDLLVQFLSPQHAGECFVLTGSAGTGKTSIIKAVTDYLHNQQTPFFLTAPTGRAARIIGKKTGNAARTLHSLVFEPELQDDDVTVLLKPRQNTEQREALYIVDESSMISGMASAGGDFICTTSLLQQFITYVQQGNKSSRILFIGDVNQLPPVGMAEPPALNTLYLQQRYHLACMHYNLAQVMRQAEGSYLLDNATAIRDAIMQSAALPTIHVKVMPKIGNALNSFVRHLNVSDHQSAVMIAQSNKQVNALNAMVRRNRFGWQEHPLLLPGESLVCNENTMLDGQPVFNGDPLVLLNTWKPETFGGCHFINAEVEFVDCMGEVLRRKTKILLESVAGDGFITIEKRKGIIAEAMKRNKKFREGRRPADDAFVSALKVRYGYALTCHKAQGGEWRNVFINPLFNKENLKWVYTAVTRASVDLYSWAA
ncbi:ATP-dependent DNA helicase [Parafilimonas sp.]|uniref:ATP-dependent DNA helicase n=1 Tax=Parafilimonas sp. TaxID=1969739 RepID=UPI0039E5236F